MVKRIISLLLVLVFMLTTGSGLAELDLWNQTPAQQMLKNYIANVNTFLLENEEEAINRVFYQTNFVVELGVTAMDDAYIPEHVTVTVYMHYDSIYYLLLRVDNPELFRKTAAAFLRALNPKTMTQEEALKVPSDRAEKAIKNPNTPFEDVEFDKYSDREAEILNGERPQTYYAYYPNQYHDQVNWMQLMIIFPVSEYWDAENGVITETEQEEAPYRDDDWSKDYDGYFSKDLYEHYQDYATPTPEPDSAAAEYDEWNQ